MSGLTQRTLVRFEPSRWGPITLQCAYVGQDHHWRSGFRAGSCLAVSDLVYDRRPASVSAKFTNVVKARPLLTAKWVQVIKMK
jgi:hypothetical protein